MRSKNNIPPDRELLDAVAVTGLDHAQRTIRLWQQDYNQSQPHGALGELVPTVFAQGAGL